MILTVTPNPCVDKTLFVDSFAPGDRIRLQRYSRIAGGKGTNVSRAVKTLGYASAAMVFVGGPTGQHIVDMIEEQDGVRCIPTWVAGFSRTITTVYEEGEKRQTAFYEPGPPVLAEDGARLVEAFRAQLEHASVVTLNGTVPDRRIERLYVELIGAAKDAGVPAVLDTHGPELAHAVEAGPALVKPNLEELQRYLGEDIAVGDALWAAMEKLHTAGVAGAVVSLGAAGAYVSWRGERFRVWPPAIDAVNPVGSGDAMVAGLAIGMQEGWPVADTLRTAVAAGTANAASWDIGHFTPAEVETYEAQVQIESV